MVAEWGTGFGVRVPVPGSSIPAVRGTWLLSEMRTSLGRGAAHLPGDVVIDSDGPSMRKTMMPTTEAGMSIWV